MFHRSHTGIPARLSTLSMAALFLVATIVPVFAPVQVSAATKGVVINELYPAPNGAGDSEWIELYNTTDIAINLENWQIRDFSSHKTDLSGTIAPLDFVIIETSYLNNDNETVSLYNRNTEIDTTSYTVNKNKKKYSLAREYDGANNFVVREGSAITKGASNGSAPATPADPVPQPTLAAEEFVAHSSDAYSGISVGFNASNFGTVTAIQVVITRADGTTVVKEGAQGAFDLLNDKATPIPMTVPFPIVQRNYQELRDVDENNHLYWIPQKKFASWTTETIPTSVTITVTGSEGTETVTNNNFSHGAPSWPTYESVLAPEPAILGENFNTYSGTDYQGINVGFRLQDFLAVEHLTVTLYSGDKLLATNVANKDLISEIIVFGTEQHSTPFITTPGTYEELYWDLGNYNWTKNSPKPTHAVVTAEGYDYAMAPVVAETILEPLSEPNGWTFDSILPAPTVSIPPVDSPNPPAANPGSTTPQRPVVQGAQAPAVTTPVANVALNTPAAPVAVVATDASDGSVEAATTKDTGSDKKNGAVIATEKSSATWYWWLATIPAFIALYVGWHNWQSYKKRD